MSSNKVRSLTGEEIDELLNKDILTLLGLQEISEEQKKEFLDNATQTIENRVFRKVMDILRKKGKLEEYDKAEDVDKFLEDEGIDVDRIYIEEALFFKVQMKSYAKVVDEGFVKLAKGAKKDDKTGDN